jgi:hypothetical protein
MITWGIKQLDYIGSDERVITIHWVCVAAEDVRQGAFNGRTGIVYKPDDPFTPFSQLTQDQVLEWLFAALGEEDRAGAEAEALNALNQIPITPSPPPWDA